MKAKREASMHTQDTERLWWEGKCPRCGNVRMRVEVGEGDSYSKGEMERLGYVVRKVKGLPEFRPHSEECAG